MNKSDQTSSARAYVKEVSSILCDLPTPSINAAVMRGAGLRFSSPAEGIPGPRRIVLDIPISGRPLATGMTAAAVLMCQRGNLADLAARRERPAHDETHANEATAAPDPVECIDQAFEVLDTLRVLPLFAGAHFSGVFDELTALVGIEQRGDTWEVRSPSGEWTGVPLDSLGRGLSLNALKAQTEANFARLLRWRNALRDIADDDESSSTDIVTKSAEGVLPITSAQHSGPPVADLDGRTPHKDALRHHNRALANGVLAERRRRFPELFSDIAFVSGNRIANTATMAEHRRRFPELTQSDQQSEIGRRAGGNEFLGLG